MADELDGREKNVRRLLGVALIAVAVSVVVLVLDYSIKQSVLDQAVKAKGLLDEARALAEGARYGATSAGENGSGPGPDFNSGNDVVHDSPAGTHVGQAEGAGHSASGTDKAGSPRRSRRDG